MSNTETKWKVRQSQEQQCMRSLECYFYSKSIFKPPSVSFLLEATPLGTLKTWCNRRGVTLNCAGGIGQPLLVHEIIDCQEMKAWDAIFICNELNVPMFEMNKVK